MLWAFVMVHKFGPIYSTKISASTYSSWLFKCSTTHCQHHGIPPPWSLTAFLGESGPLGSIPLWLLRPLHIHLFNTHIWRACDAPDNPRKQCRFSWVGAPKKEQRAGSPWVRTVAEKHVEMIEVLQLSSWNSILAHGGGGGLAFCLAAKMPQTLGSANASSSSLQLPAVAHPCREQVMVQVIGFLPHKHWETVMRSQHLASAFTLSLTHPP